MGTWRSATSRALWMWRKSESKKQKAETKVRASLRRLLPQRGGRRERFGAVSGGGALGGVSGIANGEFRAGGDCAAAAAVGGERGGAAVRFGWGADGGGVWRGARGWEVALAAGADGRG